MAKFVELLIGLARVDPGLPERRVAKTLEGVILYFKVAKKSPEIKKFRFLGFATAFTRPERERESDIGTKVQSHTLLTPNISKLHLEIDFKGRCRFRHYRV